MPMLRKEPTSLEQLCGNLHKIAGILLRSAGFHLSLRGSPDQEPELKIGIWRKSLRGKQAGPPKRFMLIPGFGDSPVSWLPVLSLLRRTLHRCYDELVLVEFPGYHGYLFNERSFPTLDALLGVFLPSMDDTHANTVLGHSLGGGLAAYYAGTRGRQGKSTGIERLLLVSPSGVFTDQALRSQIEERIQKIVENGVECLRDIRPRLLHGNPVWLKKLLTEFFKFSSQDSIQQFIRSIREDHFLEPLLPYIHGQVELLWGTNDDLIPPSVIPIWLKGLTHAKSEAVYLDGIGHAPQLESPKRLARMIASAVQA